MKVNDGRDVFYYMLNKKQEILADQFYERIKGKPFEVMNRYYKMIEPKKTLDWIIMKFQSKRLVRYAATERAKLERFANDFKEMVNGLSEEYYNI